MCLCLSGMDLLWQLYVLPHWDRTADQTCYLTQSQYTDTRPTSPSTDPVMSGTWQGSHWNASFWVTVRHDPELNPGSAALEVDTLITRPTRRSRGLRTGRESNRVIDKTMKYQDVVYAPSLLLLVSGIRQVRKWPSWQHFWFPTRHETDPWVDDHCSWCCWHSKLTAAVAHWWTWALWYRFTSSLRIRLSVGSFYLSISSSAFLLSMFFFFHSILPYQPIHPHFFPFQPAPLPKIGIDYLYNG